MYLNAEQIKEKKKRKRERIALIGIFFFFVLTTTLEFHFSKIAKTLPFVNSIFFFGLLNLNIILLLALFWMILRHVSRLLIERDRKILGSRLKTKLVLVFLAFSVIPTLVLFTISALYINASFDKWFSLKIQNTLQAALEITGTYTKNSETIAFHFADQLRQELLQKISDPSPFLKNGFIQEPLLEAFFEQKRQILALDALEFYAAPLGSRVSVKSNLIPFLSRLSLESLNQAFKKTKISVLQHVPGGDLIRCVVPVLNTHQKILGVIVVNSFIPLKLRSKMDEIASVFDDYKDTNPLKYPMKTTYSIILVFMTLMVLFVAIWLGLHMARELTIPLEKLALGAQAVGAGNLNILISPSGEDEITVLVHSFNQMTSDLRENRAQLLTASLDLERRKSQLEAVLAQISAGVVALDEKGQITLFNQAVSKILKIAPEDALGRASFEVFQGNLEGLETFIRTHRLSQPGFWSFEVQGEMRTVSMVSSSIESSSKGLVLVIDEVTEKLKIQREMAWREVARRIAHEIKNPLTPIKLSAQRLERRFKEEEGTHAVLLRECIETIIKHTDELKDMVNEFSNFARLPEVSPAPHDLNKVIQEVMKLFKQAHPDINFYLKMDDSLPIFDFDRDQMKRVFLNLMDNAISSFETKKVVLNPFVKLQCNYDKSLEMVRVEVEDNGIGISEEVKARIFEPYFSRKKEGTGLGLSIVKRIIQDHRGFIRVKSTEGLGSTFIIELPLSYRA